MRLHKALGKLNAFIFGKAWYMAPSAGCSLLRLCKNQAHNSISGVV